MTFKDEKYELDLLSLILNLSNGNVRAVSGLQIENALQLRKLTVILPAKE